MIIPSTITLSLILPLISCTSLVFTPKSFEFNQIFNDIMIPSCLSDSEEDFPSFSHEIGDFSFIQSFNQAPPPPTTPFFIDNQCLQINFIGGTNIFSSIAPVAMKEVEATKNFTLEMVAKYHHFSHLKVQVPLEKFLSSMQQIMLCRDVEFEFRFNSHFVESESEDGWECESEDGCEYEYENSENIEKILPFAHSSQPLPLSVTQERPPGHPARLPSMDYCYVAKDTSYPLRNSKTVEALMGGKKYFSSSLIIALLDKKKWRMRSDIAGSWGKLATQSSIQTPDPSSGIFPVCLAAMMGNLEILQQVLEKCPYFFHPSWRCPRYGATILHYAALGGHGKVVEWMKRKTFLFVGPIVNNEYLAIKDFSSFTARDIAHSKNDNMFIFELIKGF